MKSPRLYSPMAMFSPPFKDTNDDRRHVRDAAMQLFVAMQQPPELNAESGAPGKTPVASKKTKKKKRVIFWDDSC